MSDEESIRSQLVRLIARKRDIDGLVVDRFIERQRWLDESIELLLHIALREAQT